MSRDASQESPDRYAPPTPNVGREDPPHWSLWLPYLVFRPRLFFETFVIRSVPILTVLTAWLYGMASVMDQVETRLLRPELNSIEALLRRDWSSYWGFAMAMGVVGGALTYGIGGWWYRMRLEFCDVRDADPYLARRVYVYASQAWVVPLLLYAGWQTLAYDSPTDAIAGDDAGVVLVVAALFWSIYVSYRGVCTAFDVKVSAARLWFGVLPVIVYAVALGGVLAMVG